MAVNRKLCRAQLSPWALYRTGRNLLKHVVIASMELSKHRQRIRIS